MMTNNLALRDLDRNEMMEVNGGFAWALVIHVGIVIASAYIGAGLLGRAIKRRARR